MAIVVAPYNPWREQLAANILGDVASNYLQNQRASEAAKKWGALVGMYKMQGEDQDAATINRMVEQQRLKSQEDAAVQSLLDRKTQVGLTGVPRTNVQEYIQSGLSGATRQPLNPEIGQWNTPEGVAVSDALANRVIGSYRPPSEAETADWNINSYNSGMAGRIPLQFTPEGVFAKAAETPNFDFKGMINALSDPRFAPYATELMKNIDALQGIYDKRRNSNYLDMEAAAKANMAAYQGNMVARHAQDLPSWSTALSSRFAGPAEQLGEASKSNQMGFFDGLGKSLDAAAKDAVGRYGLMGDYAQASATRDAAKTHANANIEAARINAKTWADKHADDKKYQDAMVKLEQARIDQGVEIAKLNSEGKTRQAQDQAYRNARQNANTQTNIYLGKPENLPLLKTNAERAYARDAMQAMLEYNDLASLGYTPSPNYNAPVIELASKNIRGGASAVADILQHDPKTIMAIEAKGAGNKEAMMDLLGKYSFGTAVRMPTLQENRAFLEQVYYEIWGKK